MIQASEGLAHAPWQIWPPVVGLQWFGVGDHVTKTSEYLKFDIASPLQTLCTHAVMYPSALIYLVGREIGSSGPKPCTSAMWRLQYAWYRRLPLFAMSKPEMGLRPSSSGPHAQ